MSRQRIRVWVIRFADRDALQLQWRDPLTRKKKTHTSGTADPDEAEDARCDLEADLNAGRYEETARLPWPAFRQRFEAEYVDALRANTRKGYRRTLNLFGQLAGQAVVASIGPALVSRFAASLRTAGAAPGTQALRLQQLQTALGWAGTQGLLAAVPPFPAIRLPKKTPRPVATELFERLLARSSDPQLSAYLLCGWRAGLRLEEAFLLERHETQAAPWADFAGQRIWLPAESVKGDADQWLPLHPELRVALLALPEAGPRFFHFATARGRPITVGGVAKRILRLAQRTGVRLSMRSLRRGFVSYYAARFPAQVVQKLARHADIKTTLAHYANVDEAVMQAVLGDRVANSPEKSVEIPQK
jgi:integrase